MKSAGQVKRTRSTWIPVARTSESAVPQVSKPAWLTGNDRSTCPRVFRRTAPRPVLRAFAQTRCDRIVPNIGSNSGLLRIVPDPMVETLRLPKGSGSQIQNSFGTTRYELLPGLRDSTKQMVGHRPDDHVDVIRHDDPFVKDVAFPVEVPQGVPDQTRDIRTPEVTRTVTLVEADRDLLLKFAGGFQCAFSLNLLRHGFDLTQSRSILLLELGQYLLRHSVAQTKRDKVRRTFTFYVRQISPCMDAASQRVWGVDWYTLRSQLVQSPAPSCLLGIPSLLGHAANLAGVELSAKRRTRSTLAGLETGGTADSEICATGAAPANRISRHNDRLAVAQTSQSAVPQVSKPAWLGPRQDQMDFENRAGIGTGNPKKEPCS